MPKNVQTTTQLHSSHTLAKWCSKFSKQGFNSMWTEKFWMLKLDLEKTDKQRSNCKIHLIIEKARDFQKNIYLCFIDYTKNFVWITTNCGNFIFWIGLSSFIRDSQDYKGLKSWHWGPSFCQRWAQHWQSAGCTACASRSGLSSFSPVWPPRESDLWLS